MGWVNTNGMLIRRLKDYIHAVFNWHHKKMERQPFIGAYCMVELT